MTLTRDEFAELAETLDTSHLRHLLSAHLQRRKRRQATQAENETESSAPRPPAAQGRDEVLSEVIALAEESESFARRLCEAVPLSPKKVRRWLTEREPDAQPEWIERTLNLLVASYQRGHQPPQIPAAAVLSVLSEGIARTVAEIQDIERERNEATPIDFRTLQIERRRRADLRLLLAGLGAPEPEVFKPDDFQLEAVDLVTNQGTDVMVSAPTGSGKTWIAEQAIRRTLERGQTAWYTSPLKALSNDKLREFGRIFGPENVGLITGDRRVNPDAPLRIATTEIYRNGLYDAMSRLDASDTPFGSARLVVFDEVHYLGDQERGVVWEESIIYTPAETRILMLSATVGNAEELAEWVAWTRHTPCKLVSHPERPVPLRTAFVHPNGRLQALFESPDIARLHPDIVALYADAKQEMNERRSRRRPFYRRR
jgi:superfamily II RNA helicase